MNIIEHEQSGADHMYKNLFLKSKLNYVRNLVTNIDYTHGYLFLGRVFVIILFKLGSIFIDWITILLFFFFFCSQLLAFEGNHSLSQSLNIKDAFSTYI